MSCKEGHFFSVIRVHDSLTPTLFKCSTLCAYTRLTENKLIDIKMIELFLLMYNMFGYLHVKSKEYDKSGYFPATPRIY